jgi:hypothetical protein
MTKILFIIFILCMLLFITTLARAENWKCGPNIVYVGDSVSELQRQCGDPDFKYDTSNDKIQKEIWSYDTRKRGWGGFPRDILIRNGKIARIERTK